MKQKAAGGEASRNVARIMAIVDALADAADEGLRLTDVMHAAGLNKTTAHRLLAGLAAHSLADHDADTGRYFVGVRLLSSCDCWALNIGFTQTRNPNEVQVHAQFTLAGLGNSKLGGLRDY